MVYNITNYNGTPLVSVPDGTIDTTTTSISLIGQNSVNSGLPLNENFVSLLQHFANTSPPPVPVVGQIWFDTSTSMLKIWDSSLRWLQISPFFDGNAGIANMSINGTTEAVLILSDGHVVAAISYVTVLQSALPTTYVIADVSYPIAILFPNGLLPGINLAVDSQGLKFYGNASSANVLANARNISLTGSVTGNITFDGSANVVMTTLLPTVFNVNISAGWYTNVFVSSNGLVTDGTYITSTDVIAGLGYTPASQVVFAGDVNGNTVSNGTVFSANLYLSNTAVVPGSYTNVTVDATGRVIYGDNTNPFPLQGEILYPGNVFVPNGWAPCDGSTVTTTAGTFTTPDLSSYPVGPMRYIMRVG